MIRSVSILIPTHDRVEILGRSLESLRNLRQPEGVALEALVVANACTDATEEMVRAKSASFPFPLRLVSEPTPGLNPARNAGARAAHGEILAYLDDDAFVEPGWSLGLLNAFEAQPADLVAGRVLLWWEAIERPHWISEAVERLLSYLDLGPDPIELPGPSKVVGANFAVRRIVLEDLGGFADGLDRAGGDLMSGGDTEFAFRAARAGYRLWYSPKMLVRHWVAPSRITLRYLDGVARGRGRTRVALCRRLGEFRPWGLLKVGIVQGCTGVLGEVRFKLTGDSARSIAGRLARMKGMETVKATLRAVVGSRS